MGCKLLSILSLTLENTMLYGVSSLVRVTSVDQEGKKLGSALFTESPPRLKLDNTEGKVIESPLSKNSPSLPTNCPAMSTAES